MSKNLIYPPITLTLITPVILSNVEGKDRGLLYDDLRRLLLNFDRLSVTKEYIKK